MVPVAVRFLPHDYACSSEEDSPAYDRQSEAVPSQVALVVEDIFLLVLEQD